MRRAGFIETLMVPVMLIVGIVAAGLLWQVAGDIPEFALLPIVALPVILAALNAGFLGPSRRWKRLRAFLRDTTPGKGLFPPVNVQVRGRRVRLITLMGHARGGGGENSMLKQATQVPLRTATVEVLGTNRAGGAHLARQKGLREVKLHHPKFRLWVSPHAANVTELAAAASRIAATGIKGMVSTTTLDGKPIVQFYNQLEHLSEANVPPLVEGMVALAEAIEANPTKR